MTVLRPVLGDQLSRSLASLVDADPARDVIVMMEVAGEATHVRHHKQKIVLILSAMRAFAARLAAEGFRVDYVRLDDPANTHSFDGEMARAIARHAPTRIVATEPGEWRVETTMRGWEARFGLPVDIREDDRFFCSRRGFADWADGRKSLRMEYFYRQMRRASGVLMDGDEPRGGRWNFVAEHRKPLPAVYAPRPRLTFPNDPETSAVIALVETRFASHFGDARPFNWAVTRAGACAALDDFIAHHLPRFGDHQDAMAAGPPFLHHGALSPYLNIGLLEAREVCAAAEAALARGDAPLNAVEGFIRQILGWREYVRGVYWTFMPDYATSNALDAQRSLPRFYWTGETDMRCLADCVATTRANAYAHHIQRLMVLGNFALLAGVAPTALEEWFLIVYADAFEWVELPNVHGMALFADGGMLASKPYAASGAYIDRMSDYCGACAYDVAKKVGPQACPFNALYWDFLERNRARLAGNPRLDMPYRTLARMSEARRAGIAADAARFLASLEPTRPGDY